MINAGILVAKDGKLSFEDMTHVLKLIPLVGPAVSDLGEIPGELKDIDADELAELIGVVSGKLALTDDKAKLVVEKALKVLACVGELVVVLVK
jgi:hypothetical protein